MLAPSSVPPVGSFVAIFITLPLAIGLRVTRSLEQFSALESNALDVARSSSSSTGLPEALAFIGKIYLLPYLSQNFETLQKAFSTIDRDANGGITFQELLEFQRAASGYAAVDEAKLKDTFRSFDTDGNGRIDFPEFVALQSRQVFLNTKPKESTVMKEFNKYDQHGSGAITLSNFYIVKHQEAALKHVLPPSDDEIRAEFNAADVDGDGFIYISEYLTARTHGVVMNTFSKIFDPHQKGYICCHEIQDKLNRYKLVKYTDAQIHTMLSDVPRLVAEKISRKGYYPELYQKLALGHSAHCVTKAEFDVLVHGV